VAEAVKELKQGITDWYFWGYLGFNDVRQRYRRSIFGPFWITLSMAIFITAISIVYTRLFKMNAHDYIPFLATGYLAWIFVSTVCNESSIAFIEAASYIKEIKLPLSLFIARSLWRNTLIFFHNAIVIVVVYFIYRYNPGWNILYFIPGFLLVIANLSWMVIFLATIGSRFRDIQLIVQNCIQVLFFISPIAWFPSLVGENSLIIALNPVYYFISLIREPLLGMAPSLHIWEVMIAFAVIGWTLTILLFSRFYRRVIFWL
jgi:ABC-type polysaccharide/polyol phosphate export permease